MVGGVDSRSGLMLGKGQQNLVGGFFPPIWQIWVKNWNLPPIFGVKNKKIFELPPRKSHQYLSVPNDFRGRAAGILGRRRFPWMRDKTSSLNRSALAPREWPGNKVGPGSSYQSSYGAHLVNEPPKKIKTAGYFSVKVDGCLMTGSKNFMVCVK